MKRGKTRKNPTPVPTDNPKPRIRNATRAKAKKAFDPTPQPALARRRRQQPKRNSALLTPVPQPLIKAKIQVIVSAVPAKAVAPVHEPTPAVRHVRQPRPVPIPIPPILLEPDHTPAEQPSISGPGIRFATAPIPIEPIIVAIPELPESYGTEEIFLAARDPYWVFASWDLSESQRRRYNEKSASGALTVRLRIGDENGPIHLEIHTQPNSKDWFIHAGKPETTFVAELGYHEKFTGDWKRISVSKRVTTPADRVAAMPLPEPALAPLQRLEAPVFPAPIQAAPPSVEVAPVVFARPEPVFTHRIRWTPPPQNFEQPTPIAPRVTPVATPRWTPQKAQQLQELISLELRRTQEGSIEIEELLRRRVTRPIEETPSSLELLEAAPEEQLRALLGLAKEGAPSSLEVALPEERGRKFWFKVNAELIIYGSTEPDARVSIGGRPIRLREDGTFSYRFALPDGAFQLPVVAVSRDEVEARAADMRFARETDFIGNVGAHAQEAALKSPSPANL